MPGGWSNSTVDKVFICLEHIPPEFDPWHSN